MQIQRASNLPTTSADLLIGRGRMEALRRPAQAAPREKKRIHLRSREEIAMIARAGEVVAQAIEAAAESCKPGATTRDISDAAAGIIASAGGRSLFLNYPNYCEGHGFPGATCISVNEEVVHGIPGPRKLVPGDVVTIDCGVELDGWCADAARTVAVGEVTREVGSLLAASEAMLEAAIDLAQPGVWWSRVADRLQQMADDRGFGLVREYVGHGIGRQLHEAPQVPAYRMTRRDKDFQVRPGMVFAIEPMVTLGRPATHVLEDGWTVATTDGKPACHVEHTIAITDSGPMVLTMHARRAGC